MSAVRLTDRPTEPDSKSVRNPIKIWNPICSKKLFRVVHHRNACKHFSLEHPREYFNLDLLVLHTLWYEVMGGYFIFLVFFSSQTSYSHNFTSDFRFPNFRFPISDFRNPNLHLVVILILCFTWIISSIWPVPRDFHIVAENLHDTVLWGRGFNRKRVSTLMRYSLQLWRWHPSGLF